MTVPMQWLVATFVILQFSSVFGRNIESPEGIQHLNEFDGAEIPDNSKERYDVVWTLDPFFRTWEPPKWTWDPPVWTQKPNDIDFIVNPDIKDIDDISNHFENDHQDSNSPVIAGLGSFFGFVLLFLLIFLCLKLCCRGGLITRGRVLVVASPAQVQPPEPVRTEHYPPPPPTYNDSVQQFPPQYHPPPAAQQVQYPAVHNPGFQYSPVQQQYPGAMHSSPPLGFQNQMAQTSPYGAPPVMKY